MAGTSCPADNEIWLPNKNYMNGTLAENWRRNEAWDCAWASCAWDAWFLVPACIAVTHPSTKKPLTINNNLRVADYNMQ